MKDANIFNSLEQVAHLVPSIFYWTDINNVILGANNQAIASKVIKKDYKYINDHVGQKIMLHSQKVIAARQTITEEITVNDLTLEKSIYLLSTKTPLYDENNNIVGIIDSSVDITRAKEEILSNEYNKFKKRAYQLIQNIQQPLGILRELIQHTIYIPEHERLDLKNAAINIFNLTNQLLNKYQKPNVAQEKELILVSECLNQILSEKKHEFKEQNISYLPSNLDQDPTQINQIHKTAFTFIKTELSLFKHLITSLIDISIKSRANKIEFEINNNNDWLILSISNDGIGIPPTLIDKINNDVAFNEDDNKYSISLLQIREIVKCNQAKLNFYSGGTDIILKFPQSITPNWIQQKIRLTIHDTVIILDDDNSMHGAWDNRFIKIVEKNPTIKVIHFTQGQEVLDFVNKLSHTEKENVYLFVDYELENQTKNGLQIIEQCKIKRATLVTSHYSSIDIQAKATRAQVKILPKNLAYAVTIDVDQQIAPHTKMVDLVWIDDERMFIDGLIKHYYNQYEIDRYYEPISFLENFMQYPLDTRIILDTYYYADNSKVSYGLTGFDLAKTLHEAGYTNLCLFSGEREIPEDKPEYLTVVLKNDLENISKLNKISTED